MDDIRRIDIDAKYTNEDYQNLDGHIFFKEGGDPDFNPDRNKHIIQQTIKHQQNYYIQKRKMFNNELRERMAATESYIRWLDSSHFGSPEKYFGKRELARLRGQEVASKLKNITKIEVPGYTKDFLRRKELAKRKKVK